MSWVILDSEGKFWSGYSWVSEYPDAARYSGKPTKCPPGASWLVSSYGEVTERRLKRCKNCGRTYTRAELNRLERKPDYPSEDESGRYILEQRDCACGNTLALEHKVGGAT